MSFDFLPDGRLVFVEPLDLSTTPLLPPPPNNPFSSGCTLYVDLAISIPLVNQGGTASWTIQVPAMPSLQGFVFYTQGVILDQAAGSGVVTNAAEGVIGMK
jgi:hypothetical protein